jgi:hypothetical protein
LHSSDNLQTANRTKTGPNSRLRAIRDTQNDILDSLKRLSKYTTDVTNKKLYDMTYESFTEKQVGFPQYRRLCEQTIRVTMDEKC